MWQPGWEGSLGENGYVYMYGWVPLLSTRNDYDIINQLCVCSVTQLCLTLCNPMDCSPRGSSVLGDSPGKNTGVGCHALLQGIFPTQGLNPGLPHCRQILYRLSHQGSLLISYTPVQNKSLKKKNTVLPSFFVLNLQVNIHFSLQLIPTVSWNVHSYFA